jgi:Integrin beta cytoplasmic domain
MTDDRIKCMALVKKKDMSQQHNFIYDINKDHDTFLTIEEYQTPSILVSNLGLFSLLGVILMTLLFGLIGICCYVCLLRAKDRKELAAFEKRLEDTKYEFESPIYKSPITEFRVPQKREDGGFEMISNPTPKTPGTGGSDKFMFTNNGTVSPSPTSPGVVLRPPFKQSPSVVSNNIIYQTSSVLAKDITNSASPTENSSSIIFQKFPVEPFHLNSSVTSATSTMSSPIPPKPTPRNLPLIAETEPTPSTYVNQKFDDNHHSIRTTTVNHQRPISPMSTFAPHPDERYFRTPSAPMRPLSPTSSQTSRYYVNGQECDLPFDDSSSSASTVTRNVNRSMAGEEMAQTPQRATSRRYFVNGQEVDQPFDDSGSSVSTTTRNIYRTMPSQEFVQTPQRTTVRRYFVDEQGVEQPFFDDDHDASTTTTKTIFRTFSNSEPPMTPLRVQHVQQQPQLVVKKVIHQTPTQQRREYFNTGDDIDGQLVETETTIRRTVTESGQDSPVLEKFITIRTTEQRGSPSN